MGTVAFSVELSLYRPEFLKVLLMTTGPLISQFPSNLPEKQNVCEII